MYIYTQYNVFECLISIYSYKHNALVHSQLVSENLVEILPSVQASEQLRRELVRERERDKINTF